MNSSRIKRIRIFAFVYGYCLVAFFSPSQVFTQTTKAAGAVVIVASDYLRERPISTSTPKLRVRKGSKLVVVRDPLVKGWYFAREVETSAWGYISGNSIKLVNPPVVPRKNQPDWIIYEPVPVRTVPPKSIILDTTPDLAAEDKSRTVIGAIPEIPKLTNHCTPTLFCPDIGDVHTGLLLAAPAFEKGKFEKTAEWEIRKKGLLSDVRFGGIKSAADTMTFLYEQGTGSLVAADADYDADTEKWTFPLNLFDIPTGFKCVPMMGQQTGELFCLVINKFPERPEILVSMPPSIAKQNNEKLQVAFVGRITAPYLWNHTYEKVDGISSGVYFELEEIICVNPKTGQRWKVDSLTFSGAK